MPFLIPIFNERQYHVPMHVGLKSQSYLFLPQTTLNVSFLRIEILFCYLCVYPTQHLARNKCSRNNSKLSPSLWPQASIGDKRVLKETELSSEDSVLLTVVLLNWGSMDMSVNPLKILWKVFMSGYTWSFL